MKEYSDNPTYPEGDAYDPTLAPVIEEGLNQWQRPRMGLIDFLLLPVAILVLPFFVIGLNRLNKQNEEMGRYAEKRRADLVNRLT